MRGSNRQGHRLAGNFHPQDCGEAIQTLGETLPYKPLLLPHTLCPLTLAYDLTSDGEQRLYNICTATKLAGELRVNRLLTEGGVGAWTGGLGTGGNTTFHSWVGFSTSPQASPITKLQISSGPIFNLLRTYTTSPCNNKHAFVSYCLFTVY